MGADAQPLKVFISYSRKDVDFADDLELFLDTRGFDPILDRHDIDHNDDWRTRLEQLLLSCDVVVFVLTETSAASPICRWEVAEAARMGKRRLVVTPGPLPDGTEPPEGLGAANWIHCWRNPAVPGASIAKGKRELETALRADVGWLRERTRLMEQAASWSARTAAADSPLLLRGEVLVEAQAWARKTPREETVPDGVTAFLSASEALEARQKAEAEAGLKEKEQALASAVKASRNVRRASLIGAAVAAVFLVAAIVAGWFASSATESLRGTEAQLAMEARVSSTGRSLQADIGRQEARQTFALLMALYADPAASKTEVTRRFDGEEGYRRARFSLAAAGAGMTIQKLLVGHQDPVTSVAISPDNRFIVTASIDGTACIWDADSGKPLHVLQGHEGPVRAAAFSPSGRMVATGSADRAARVWDVESGKLLVALQGHQDEITSVVFSSDGQFVVTGSSDHTASMWNVSTGALQRTLTGHGAAVTSVASFQNGQVIVTGSEDGSARVWNLSDNEPTHILRHDGVVHSVGIFADGSLVVTGSRDGAVRLWSLESGDLQVTLPHEAPVYATAISPDGRFLATGARDGFARIWDLKSDAAPRLMQHGSAVNSVGLSADGRFLVTGSDDGMAHIWKMAGEGVLPLEDRVSQTYSAAFSADGRTIVTGTYAGIARVWDSVSGKQLPTSWEKHEGPIYSVAFSADGHLMATGSRDDTARIWKVDNAERLFKLQHGDDVLSVAFSTDGRLLVTGSVGDVARVWDTATGNQLFSLEGSQDVASAAFSTDGKILATSSSDGTAHIWDAKSGAPLRTFSGHKDQISSVAFSSDDRLLLTASMDGTARIWDASSGAEVRQLSASMGEVFSASFSPDGRLVVTGSADGKVRIWDAAGGTELAVLLLEGAVRSTSFSTDGKQVVAAPYDGLPRIWTVPEIVVADAGKQVRVACEMLWRANAPLALRTADIADHGVLEGLPIDPDHADLLVSPCRGILPPEAFDPATAQDAWMGVYRAPSPPVATLPPP